MELAAYSYREDEREFFEKFGKQYGVKVRLIKEAPSPENTALAAGCESVSVITTAITDKIIERWHEAGVRCISTRTIGYEHIDCEKAWELGMTVSNVSYSSGSVADYTVMMILMVIRRIKYIMKRFEAQDCSLFMKRGRELANMTVGVIGTGKIGEHVIKNLSGFGCRVLAYDLYPKESVGRMAQYVDFDTLLGESDVITLHTPATPESLHMICRESIEKMKDGAVIINTARGSLIDTDDLIDALESGKIGAAGLDVIENEMGIYYGDHRYKVIHNRQRAVLNEMPNVLLLPHTAFFTDQAVSDMVEYSIVSCLNTVEGRENPWEIKK